MYKQFAHKSYETLYIELGEKSAPTLLYLPGYMGKAQSSLDLLNLLGTKFHTYAIDYPFVHKKSEKIHLDHILSLISNFIKFHSLENIYLAGESLGGIIASHFVSKYDYLPSKIILISSTPKIYLSKIHQFFIKCLHNNRLKNTFRDITIIGRKIQTKRYTKQRLEILNQLSLEYWNEIIESVTDIVETNHNTHLDTFHSIFQKMNLNQKIAIMFMDDNLINYKNHEFFLKTLGFKIQVEPTGGHNSTPIWSESVYRNFLELL